ncbi:MAG: malto-oligosyltrehalose trehalohydrolase [Niastella sp.]|nr:malto-oligosyltrehalose trehalohydrolase [Niastella sp.]
MNTIYPIPGALLQPNGDCVFTVWAPLSEQVYLHITKRDTRHAMQRDEAGYWTLQLPNIDVGTHYHFEPKEGVLRPDPASRHQPEGVHGPSAVTDGQQFAWGDESWTGIEPAQLIIYELHTGTFSSEGTFQGIISRLPYLQSLGITAIELMPVAQFPGQRNWGYDGVYPFAVQNSYGAANDLKALVNAAHTHGIAVILDVVYNHLGPEGNYVNDYGPYFSDKYKTPWAKAINMDDAWCDGVRNFFLQNALMWLEEFHVDGLRLDAVHAIWDVSARPFLRQLSNAVRELEKRTGKRKILIAELDYNDPKYIDPPYKGGYGLDMQWIDEFHHALHAVITGEVNGYYEDFGELAHLVKAFNSSYVYTGEYSIHRKKHFGALPGEHPYHQFVVFAQNHDQVGNRLAGDRLTASLSTDELKLVAATVLLSPHIPMLFMGEEYGETNSFQFFTDHSEPELIASLREGRKREFSYFNWEGDVPDPQSEEVFAQSMLTWQTDNERGAVLLAWYKQLINFRKTRPAMQNYERGGTKAEVAGAKLLYVERQGNGDTLAMWFNFGDEVVNTNYAGVSSLRKVFFSCADDLPAGIEANDVVMVPAHSVIVYAITNS